MEAIADKIQYEGLTYDDVLLIPRYSEVLPHEVVLTTRIHQRIVLKIPILSAAMDTVTEANLACALAKMGGLGVIHKNMSIEEQVAQVAYVRSQHVDDDDCAMACIDDSKKLCVAAAVSVGSDLEARVDALVQADVSVITIDSAHGHSKGILDAVRLIRQKYNELPIIAGNIVTAQAAQALCDAGVSAIKVGVGPGSICTTRVVAGVGVPQLSAIAEVAKVCKKRNVFVIADGGIKLSGDIVKAIAAGADCVMLGSLFAGCEEAPGELFVENGKSYKAYVGMGSVAAMKRGSKDRYFQSETKEVHKLVPEGIEGRVPYKGLLSDVVYQLLGGLRSGMGYCGTQTIQKLQTDGTFVRISNAGLKESHPHSIERTMSAPNCN